MKAATKKSLKQIGTLLKSKDLGHIVQASELAVSLEEPEVIESLLADCVVDLNGNLLLSKMFTDRSKKTRWGVEMDPARQGALTSAVLTLLSETAQASVMERLRIDRQTIPALPTAIARFTSLSALSLLYVGVERLPEGIEALAQLKALDLLGNKLSALPTGLFSLPLRTLGLQSNKLERLPKDIAALSALESLDLGSNALSTLPSLEGCKALKGLGLRNNQFSQMPESLLAHRGLERLDLRDNPIKTLPSEIAQLHQLKALWLDVQQLEATPQLSQWLPNTKIWHTTGKPHGTVGPPN